MRSRGSSTWEDMALSIPLPSLETAALTACGALRPDKEAFLMEALLKGHVDAVQARAESL